LPFSSARSLTRGLEVATPGDRIYVQESEPLQYLSSRGGRPVPKEQIPAVA